MTFKHYAAPFCRFGLFSFLFLALALDPQVASAQNPSSPSKLSRDQFRSGEEILRALAPISTATRQSIVKFNVDGKTVSLGAVVETNGLTLTKASELKKGKLTCWLANDKEVEAELISADDQDDVALVRVKASGLKPIQWETDESVQVGQWAITPGIAKTPHAVGIVSALPRRIRPERAFIGVVFDEKSSAPKVDSLLAGFGAEKAGLKQGDIILAVNSAAVTNRQQVVEIIREFREGQTVHLRVKGAEQDFDADVQLLVPRGEQERGFFPLRSTRLRGDVSRRAEGFEEAIEHDTVLQPWLCGGPLVNLEGKAIGLNIARAGRVSTYALPAKLVQRIVENLKTRLGTASSPQS
jgi:serine protease Do